MPGSDIPGGRAIGDGFAAFFRAALRVPAYTWAQVRSAQDLRPTPLIQSSPNRRA